MVRDMETTHLARVARLAALFETAYPSRSAAYCMKLAARCLRDVRLSTLEELTAQRCADAIAQRPDYSAALDARRAVLRMLGAELRTVIAEGAARG